MMRGGTEMGTLTISRFFVAHVFFVPACIFALVASHIFLFRKAGAAGPVDEDPYHPKQKTELFYPRQVLMDLSLTALLIAGLGAVLFRPNPVGAAGESGGYPVHPSARMVLPAHLSMAEVLARIGSDCRRSGHSYSRGDCDPRRSLSRPEHRAASVETAGGNGILCISSLRAGGPRPAQ